MRELAIHIGDDAPKAIDRKLACIGSLMVRSSIGTSTTVASPVSRLTSRHASSKRMANRRRLPTPRVTSTCTLCLFSSLAMASNLRMCFNSSILVSFSRRIYARLSLLGPLKETCVHPRLGSNANMGVAMSILCKSPLHALHGVCSMYSVIWLPCTRFVEVASRCGCCLAANVTILSTHVEGNF